MVSLHKFKTLNEIDYDEYEKEKRNEKKYGKNK